MSKQNNGLSAVPLREFRKFRCTTLAFLACNANVSAIRLSEKYATINARDGVKISCVVRYFKEK
jgi:hypothetical protein